MGLRICLRTDASIQIGTGHVMRCLTLADELTRQGHECRFVCREHEGHLGDLITSKGHGLTLLPSRSDNDLDTTGSGSEHYALWLGVPWQVDARQTFDALTHRKPDWLVVDHYALDADWERALSNAVGSIMVIDDLANRSHECALLLDQNLGRLSSDYDGLVPADCQRLCGSQYALLRPEFAALRLYSLQRRAQPALRELLITMGGVDKDNATGQVLQALRTCPLPADCRITVVMGATAPWLAEVRTQAQDMPWPTRVLVGVSDMAQLMADSDLAIGAAGATSWERSCLGLPAIMLVLAENQRKIAAALCEAGAACMVDASKLLDNQQLITHKCLEPLWLGAMSAAAAAVTDGSGVAQVLQALICQAQHANQFAV